MASNSGIGLVTAISSELREGGNLHRRSGVMYAI
jgi:hypothetical protein